MQMVEVLLQMHHRCQRNRVLIRLDAGFGNDQNINWLLHRGYQVLSKGKSGKRASFVAGQIQTWSPLDNDKWIAEVPVSLSSLLSSHQNRRAPLVQSKK
jgi:hypothetical protein